MFRLRRPPRFSSWRRLVFFGSAFLLFWIFVFSLTPLVFPLPEYTGPHRVGVLDVEVEVERRVIGEAVLRATGERAFELSTLAVTLYYPSVLPTSSPSIPRPIARPWLPQPISLIGRGYARIAGVTFPPFQSLFTFMLWLLGSKTVIPGTVGAPLLSREGKILVDESGGVSGLGRIFNLVSGKEKERGVGVGIMEEGTEEGRGALPCVVFTHGMAGMSQSYSHYLGSIASHGVVVAAVEHRDGSGPGSIIHFPDGKKRTVWHLKPQDFVSEPPITVADLQVAQLAFREAEIEETIRLFSLLNAGHGDLIPNRKPNSPRSTFPGFKNRLDMSAVTVVGHSYGATGALQALKNAPSEKMPINGAIMLDPGKGSGRLNKEIDVPILVMHSGEWTEKQVQFYGQGWHFDVVKKLVESTKKGWFMTLSGTAHPSCTDAPLIVPWIMKMVTRTTLHSKVALKEYIDVSVEFLSFLRNGDIRGVLKSDIMSPDGPLGDSDKRGKVKGKDGADWEVHVVPEK
ncbi:hypothetical protein K505DRAFT_321913 [Melanomma pulvis-pyrius CBS 109.77]|uniref:Putative phospholipase n=1 Tax=Melanomma pulvis-pyrius CBS 109.77 TaxID=1314802 RepID=A0A6A6XQ57_9PLEO|nr:hypothetical protein K505DRAFT_321913 [Melanomma pulvis-pyrius CBS 109.77]